MANPALRRSDKAEPGGSEDGSNTEQSPHSIFASHTTADLIALRDRLLEECFDLETQDDEAGDGLRSTETDLGLVREKIDEIHQELALRDLADRANSSAAVSIAEESQKPGLMAGRSGYAAEAARKSVEILDAIEMRSRFMDELARAAREEGHLDQAATFTLDAQKLDMERVQVLRQLSALSLETTDTDG